MKLYEFITPSDPITFYAPDNDIAEAVAILVGNGQAGIKAVDKSKTPNTMVFLGFSDEQQKRYEKIMAERIKEILEAAHTFACCPSAYREEYDKLTNNGQDKEAVEKWDDKHRSSMSNWCGYARKLKLEKPSVK